MIREGINKMKLIKKQNNKKGFTLIELVIVIAILAILALILIPAMGGYIGSANTSKDQADARSIYTAASIVASEKQDVTDGKTLVADVQKKANIKNGDGTIEVELKEAGVVKYIQFTPKDEASRAIYFDGKEFTKTAPSKE